MTAWLVRAGGNGEREDFVLANGCAGTGFDEVGDLTVATDRSAIIAAVEAAYPAMAPKAIGNYAAQLNALRNKIITGDLVALPLKRTAQIAIGRVTSAYRYDSSVDLSLRHAVGVEWMTTEVPRTAIGQDLLYSLGAFSTICEMRRNDAAYRLEQLAKNGTDPGARVEVDTAASNDAADSEVVDTSTTLIDIVEQSRNLVMERVHKQFHGHAMERLVAAVLEANGFMCKVVPEGPDGGIDIYAGRGPLGLDSPRLVVQVKSSAKPEDVRTVRELQGVLANRGADQGLLVAWGGITKPAEREVSALGFKVRVWDSNDLLKAIYDCYDKLPEDVRSQLSLQRVWTLAGNA
jgi:restriction system protein